MARELYEWTGTENRTGKSVTYQTRGPDVPESAMRDHLAKHYPHCTITAIRRIKVGEAKPATGVVAAHTFQHGILEDVKRELGLLPAVERESMLDRLKAGILSPNPLRQPLRARLAPLR